MRLCLSGVTARPGPLSYSPERWNSAWPQDRSAALRRQAGEVPLSYAEQLINGLAPLGHRTGSSGTALIFTGLVWSAHERRVASAADN